MMSVTAKYCASGNGGEIYFWNFCGGQATHYYFSSLGASLTIEEEEYLRKKSQLADVQLGKETVLTESTIRQELISLYTSLSNVPEGTEFHTFLQTEKEGLLVKLAQYRSEQEKKRVMNKKYSI